MDPHSNIIEINTESSINESLDRCSETETDDEIPIVSIFKVPETITTKKPEAYKPQQIGFGPHRGPEKNRMEQRKRYVVEKIQQRYKINDFKLTVVDKVLKIVPDIREYYEMLLQDDDASMARDFALDGLFLLDLFQSYDSTRRDGLLAQDIIMLENQIPFMVLKKIHKALSLSSSADYCSPSIYRSFSEIHSPLMLCPQDGQSFHVEHLLGYMYHSILFNEERRSDYATMGAMPPFIIFEIISFLGKLPIEIISQLYEQVITVLQKFSETKNTLASASKLQDRAGFRFGCLPKDGGIKSIKIEGNCFYLPCITLKDDSDVILRNLIAYEKLNRNLRRSPLTEYMVLMCWLIVDVEDVKILKNVNIIQGDLGEDEVAKLFTNMSLSNIENSSLKETIDEAIKVYESRPTIKAYLFLKKLANWLLVGLTALGSFAKATWKIVAFLITIVTMCTLTYEGYCEIFGCEQKIVTFSYASS